MSLLVKGASLRAHVNWLRRENKLEAVYGRLPEATRRLVDDLPLASTWVDFADWEPFLRALEAVVGLDGVLRMSRDTLHQDSFMSPLRPMLAGVLRLFGTSPATLYRHLDEMVKSNVKGMKFVFEDETERSGIMRVSYDVDHEVPGCVFVSCQAALETVIELCGARGVVAPPERTGPATVRFRIRW
jgi:hypothetical protein